MFFEVPFDLTVLESALVCEMGTLTHRGGASALSSRMGTGRCLLGV